jgi:hypothetical protein
MRGLLGGGYPVRGLFQEISFGKGIMGRGGIQIKGDKNKIAFPLIRSRVSDTLGWSGETISSPITLGDVV